MGKKTSGKTKNKMGGRRPERITNPRTARMEETSRRLRKREASSDGGQGPEGALASWMDRWKGSSEHDNKSPGFVNLLNS